MKGVTQASSLYRLYHCVPGTYSLRGPTRRFRYCRHVATLAFHERRNSMASSFLTCIVLGTRVHA